MLMSTCTCSSCATVIFTHLCYLISKCQDFAINLLEMFKQRISFGCEFI